MDQFIYEDGKGNLHNEEGEQVEVLEMEVDEVEYPLEDVTNYNMYLDLKPPEKPVKIEQGQEQVDMKSEEKSDSSSENKRTHRSYKPEVKNYFFYLIYEKGMSVRAAAQEIKVPQSTAQTWKKKAELAGDEEMEPRQSGSGRKAGRPPVLTEEHQQFLINFIDERPSSVLDEMIEGLTSHFAGLTIKKSALHDFVTKKCNITLKRAHFHSIERNSPEKIEERYCWVKKMLDTDMDYLSNCVFIDEAAFHINMKRSVAWSRKGERAVVVVPKTRAKTTTILGAICAYGVVNIRVRRPKVQTQNKKRKAERSMPTPKEATKRGTVTGHYFNFVASCMDIMDQHSEFKDYYLVMDNAPIHKHKDIQKYIEGRGYHCLYLPSYSPELNPIEQFWSVAKSKLKREKLLEEETLTSRIRDACNDVLFSDLQGFCRYSVGKFDDCLNRKPL